MIAFLTPLAADGISYAFGFVFFGTNLAAALLVWFFLYESRTLSLEHVDLMYGQPNLKAWTSHRWVPPGYVTRRQREEGQFRRTSLSSEGIDEKGDANAATESREEIA